MFLPNSFAASVSVCSSAPRLPLVPPVHLPTDTCSDLLPQFWWCNCSCADHWHSSSTDSQWLNSHRHCSSRRSPFKIFNSRNSWQIIYATYPPWLKLRTEISNGQQANSECQAYYFQKEHHYRNRWHDRYIDCPEFARYMGNVWRSIRENCPYLLVIQHL
jgi:hypothetical protein